MCVAGKEFVYYYLNDVYPLFLRSIFEVSDKYKIP